MVLDRPAGLVLSAARAALCLAVLPCAPACASPLEVDHPSVARPRSTGRRMSVIPGATAEPDRSSSPQTPHVPPPEPDDILASTREIKAQCDRGHVPCREAAFYSAALALADGTVLAATNAADASKSALEILRPGGARCHAPVRCNALFAPPSGELWCFQRQEVVCNDGVMRSGPAFPQIGYSRDAGATWRVAEVDASAVEFRWAAAPAAEGIVFADHGSGRIWSVQALTSTNEIRLHSTGTRPPGLGSADVALFSPEIVCEARNDADLDCRATGDRQWYRFGSTHILMAVSTERAWWGVDRSHRLLRSSIDPASWTEVAVGPELQIDALSLDGSANGEIVALARQGASPVVLRVDAGGHSVVRLPALPKLGIIAFGGEGAKLAIGGPEGVYVLDRSSWRRAMPACRGN